MSAVGSNRRYTVRWKRPTSDIVMCEVGHHCVRPLVDCLTPEPFS